MKSKKRSEYKIDPKTGEILNEKKEKKENKKGSSMFPNSKLIEDHEFDYVIGGFQF